MADQQLVGDDSCPSETRICQKTVHVKCRLHSNELDVLSSTKCSESTDCSSVMELQSDCNPVSSDNSTGDSFNGADIIDSNGQPPSAPFGFPLCLRLIENSMLFVLENDSVGVQQDTAIETGKCSSNSGCRVSESACQFINKQKKQCGKCEDCDDKQAELLQRYATLKKHTINDAIKSSDMTDDAPSNFNNGIESTESDVLNKAENIFEIVSSAVNLDPSIDSFSKFLENGELEKTCGSPNIIHLSVCNGNGIEDNSLDQGSMRPAIDKDRPISEVDAVDDAEWKSVEARRKKKDASSKTRELPIVESKSVWSMNRVPVSTASDSIAQRPINISNRSSTMQRTKAKAEQGSSTMTAGLNLDSLSFPELPTLFCRNSVGSHVVIEAQTFEAPNDLIDSEHLRPLRHVNGQPVGNIPDSNSYASVLIGTKSKSFVASSTSLTCSNNAPIDQVTVCDNEANSSIGEVLSAQADDESYRSALSPKLSLESVCKTGVEATLSSFANDCAELIHCVKSTSSCVANCDTVELAESCSAFVIPCNKPASSFISFGDVQLFPGDTICGSFVRALLNESTACVPMKDQSGDTVKNDASASHVIKSSSILSNEPKSDAPKSSVCFFDTRLKKMPSSISNSPFDVVFGFDPTLPISDTIVAEDTCVLPGDMPDLSALCAVETSQPIKNVLRQALGTNSHASASSGINRFNLKSVQAYLNAAFNEVKASRESNPGDILYYGVDIK